MGDAVKPDEVKMPPCIAHQLETHGNIVLLAKENNGPTEHIICELTIKCKVCGLPWRFKVDKHMPHQFHPSIPTVSADFQMLRLPIVSSKAPLVKEEISRLKKAGLILPKHMMGKS